MENILDHCDLLEVMEGTEKRSENEQEKSLWVRKSAQGYLLLGQASRSTKIRHIKPFQREPEKGPKAWANPKGVHAPATAAVAEVLERQMVALRIEEDEAVEGVQKFFNLLTRLDGADLNYSELQKKTKLLALLPESWSSLIINLNRDLPHLSLEDFKRAILQEDFRRRELASADGAGAASIGRGMTPRVDLLTELEPSPVKHVTLDLGQRAEVKGMGNAMFKGADGSMVGLKNVLWVSNLAASLISVRRLQKASMDTSSKGGKTYTARLVKQIFWDLHEDRDVFNEMWQIHVVPMPNERQVATSINTKSEAVGSGDGANGRAKDNESKKCNLGRTCKLSDPKKSGAAAKEQQNGEENPEQQRRRITERACGALLRVRHSPIRLRLRGSVIGSPCISEYGMLPCPSCSSYSALKHVELPLELSIGSTTTRQASLVNGGEETKDAEEEEEEVQQSLHVPAAEEEERGKRRIQAPNRLTYEALGKPTKSALAGAAMMVGDDNESEYEEFAFAFFSPVEMPGEPAILNEALESSDADEWKKAMESELKSIEENGTWELEKVDYKEFFAPVVKPTTLPTLLAGATIKGWVVKQMDVTTSFLNDILEEEIFMAQPEGFDDGSGRVWKLKKALYGLKQAPRQWYLKLREVLEEIGFTPSSADHSLFMLDEGEQRSFMVVYVDDILIFSPSSDLVKEVMLKLQDKFKCKALGDMSFYLGGGPTSWESKKQVDQALSTKESEDMALFRAIQEIVWQQRLLAELREEQQRPTPLYCNSQSAIAIAKNPVLHGLTKHMRVK
ncbi:unnamed protein product [Closterium sp. NIES-54]